MINRILMELYDDYERGNIESLIDFREKPFLKTEQINYLSVVF